jgi:GDP-4-dehydro-6-deoxy-D-mannose reductase
MRPSDFPLYVGDSTATNQAIKWISSISIDESLLDILNYWRTKVDSGDEL